MGSSFFIPPLWGEDEKRAPLKMPAWEARALSVVPHFSLAHRMWPFFAWGDFHVCSPFAHSIIPEEKWGTTPSLHLRGRLQEVRLRSDSTMWSEYLLLVLLGIGLVSAVTNFYRSDVELTFSFLLVLRLSLHAVYYTKNETSEQSVFLDADLLTHFVSLDAGSQAVSV